MAQVTLQELLEAGVHFGHQARRWNPKMKPYIYAAREGVHIIDLGLTAQKLQEACLFVKSLAKTGMSIIFVGTKRQAKPIVEEEAKRCGAFYITERWFGGMLTNWEQINRSLQGLRELKEKREQGQFGQFTKKERSLIDKKIERSERFLGGVENLKEPPKAIFIIDTNREKNAVLEANKKGVSVVAVVDTNSNPDLIDYPIPGNDDAIRSIRLITQAVANAVLEGKQEADKLTAEKSEVSEVEVKKEKVEPTVVQKTEEKKTSKPKTKKEEDKKTKKEPKVKKETKTGKKIKETKEEKSGKK